MFEFADYNRMLAAIDIKVLVWAGALETPKQTPRPAVSAIEFVAIAHGQARPVLLKTRTHFFWRFLRASSLQDLGVHAYGFQ